MGGMVTWAVFTDTDGKPKVELSAFCRGKGIISEWVDKKDAERALAEYKDKAKEEAGRHKTQCELPFG